MSRDATTRKQTLPGLSETGEDPDPRFSMANERTFLAWNRTALALVGGGLVVSHLLDFENAATRTVLALVLIAFGAVAALASYSRWERNERAMRLGEPLPYSHLPALLAYGVGAVAVLAGIAVLLDLALS